MRTVCVICDNMLNHFYSLDHFPKKMICTNNLFFEYDSLSFSICSQCNTIQLDKLIPLNELYDGGHNFTSVGKTWENFLCFFCEKIETFIQNKVVLEIGCPSGKIAIKSRDYKKWYIVDPNRNQKVIFPENIIFVESFFDESFILEESVDIILHSHLFEHIYEPTLFLQKCYSQLRNGGSMFFAIPNMDHIAQQNLSPCNGVFFEHNIFYNKENVSYLLCKNGFKIIDIFHYEKHSLIFHVEKQNMIVTDPLSEQMESFTGVTDSTATSRPVELLYPSPRISFDYLHLFENSIIHYSHFVEKCIDVINSNTHRKVYIFGASYNTQFTIHFFANKVHFDGILDNCIEKQNMYFYGSGLTIFDPTVILNDESIVILKNGYYCDEIQKQLTNISSSCIIIS